jgi:mevalonate kinase
MSSQRFYAHGKLMLTGEYAVLDGAKALAFPTRFGQSLEVSNAKNSPHQITWQSFDFQGNVWMNAHLPSNDYALKEYVRLQEILRAVEALNSDVFFEQNFAFTTILEFPQKWGLGSSSTLISLLAQWASIDPFELLDKTFGGSGYDIACASSDGPIVYQNFSKEKLVKRVELSMAWTRGAFFIYLNQKKNSREAIKHYKSLSNTQSIVTKVNQLTDALVQTTGISEAMHIIEEHENLMSATLDLENIQKSSFVDFKGVCKSLGAWGGDFMLALTAYDEEYVRDYFESKGFNTIFTYDKLLWK